MIVFGQDIKCKAKLFAKHMTCTFQPHPRPTVPVAYLPKTSNNEKTQPNPVSPTEVTKAIAKICALRKLLVII